MLQLYYPTNAVALALKDSDTASTFASTSPIPTSLGPSLLVIFNVLTQKPHRKSNSSWQWKSELEPMVLRFYGFAVIGFVLML
ncbi:uncharacterized protein G2W53_023458 [Senna tora]|uniref:Uncharacterized protein n=1 Tax=Senna tora TaxID=362788 RepID=A0A834T960_9FABA|nr:uncharacterized protein G2W53_023458 [Senna tora]